MKLKATVKSLDAVPEAYHGLYTQVGDEYVLDLDDSDYKSRLSEFRSNNISLTNKLKDAEKQAEELAALKGTVEKYKDIDPEKARAALKQLQDIEEKKLLDEGQIDELLAQRTERMRKDYEAQVKAAIEARDAAEAKATGATSELSKVIIDNGIQQAATAVGAVRKGAMRDIVSRAREVWKLNDRNIPTPYKEDGTVMYGKDGENPLSMEEWAQGLRSEYSYLFEGNAGGGAGGNDDNKGAQGVIDSSDSYSVSQNLEKIASGEVTVIQGGKN